MLPVVLFFLPTEVEKETRDTWGRECIGGWAVKA
jgi:hypothetical protein